MITMWAVYSLLLSALAGLAALALERLAAIWALPRRFAWLVAILAACAVPFLGLRRPAPVAAMSGFARGGAATVAGPRTGARVARAGRPSRGRLALARFTLMSRKADKYARPLWIGGSLIVLVAFGRALLSLARRRGTWTPISLGGQEAWLATDIGPAVVGLVRPRIVIPKWALELAPAARDLMLRHEQEHIRAGDPYALLVASALLVLFPWNLALWWMVRRLRLAIEVDCDARVIAAVGHRREYGLLLVAVGERRSVKLPLAASLAQQQPFLERRINAMTATRPRRPLLASLPFVAVAVIATAAASQTPVPATGAGGRVVGSIGMDSLRARSAAQQELIRTLITNYYPGVLTGSSDARRIAFVLDANDRYVTSSVGSGDVAPPTAAIASRVASGAAGGVAAGGFASAGAGSGSGSGSGGSVSASGGAGSNVITLRSGDTVRAVARPASGPLDLSAYGLGSIDRALIRGTAASSFRAGVIGPNGLDVYIVRLK